MDFVPPESPSETDTTLLMIGLITGLSVGIILVVVAAAVIVKRAPLSKERSEMLGVSLEYLLTDLVYDAEKAAKKVVDNPLLLVANSTNADPETLTTNVNPNFYDIKVMSHTFPHVSA